MEVGVFCDFEKKHCFQIKVPKQGFGWKIKINEP